MSISSADGAARPALIGKSAWARRTQAQIDTVAPYASSVLVTGPSGTGKELVARSIHERSPRAGAPFVPVNCAAITGSLFESHMFGHLKGAFTGSEYEALGCFRAAEGGTLFLDELGELDPTMQAKLLRALQERVVTPVGSHEEQPVNVRVVAATNRDLLTEVAEGRFREDLYYRLAVITIPTDPLCGRVEDIELLADYLLSSLAVRHGLPYKPLDAGALVRLQHHGWPGNVRELQNVLERGCMISRGSVIRAEDIVFDRPMTPAATGPPSAPPQTPPPIDLQHNGEWPTMEECERSILAATLRRTNNNQTAAARLLDLDRSVFRRRLKKLGLDADRVAVE